MPLSACCGPREVMDAWPPSTGEAIHTSTFLGHPLCCAAGLAFLSVLEADDLAGRARRLGDHALECLTSALEGCEHVVEVRGRGLMLGVELRGSGGAGRGAEVAARALERGLIVLPAGRGGEVVELTPPATLAREELESGLRILAGVLRSAG